MGNKNHRQPRVSSGSFSSRLCSLGLFFFFFVSDAHTGTDQKCMSALPWPLQAGEQLAAHLGPFCDSVLLLGWKRLAFKKQNPISAPSFGDVGLQSIKSNILGAYSKATHEGGSMRQRETFTPLPECQKRGRGRGQSLAVLFLGLLQ